MGSEVGTTCEFILAMLWGLFILFFSWMVVFLKLRDLHAWHLTTLAYSLFPGNWEHGEPAVYGTMMSLPHLLNMHDRVHVGAWLVVGGSGAAGCFLSPPAKASCNSSHWI